MLKRKVILGTLIALVAVGTGTYAKMGQSGGSGAADLTTATGILPVANGGTAMATQYYVEGKIAGGTTGLGTTNNTTGHTVENASWAFTQRIDVSGAAAAKIMCADTITPTGSTCSGGNEGLGIAITTGAAGYYKVCFNFNVAVNNVSGSVINTFYVVRTGLNNLTVAETGDQTAFTFNTAVGSLANVVTLCGGFGSLSASTAYGFRVLAKLTASGAITSNDLQNSDSFGEHVSVYVERL